MSLQSAQDYFEQFGLKEKILVLEESSATVELAAIALHTEPAQIAKTLSFLVGTQPVLILMEGTARIDNHKYKEKFHKKAKMMTREELLEYVGHEPGGVCPFGIKDGVDVYLDESLKKFETVFPAAGSGNSAIELTIPELERYSNFKEWVDVTKESVEG